MQELIPVNVTIGDRTYRVRIEAGDEEHVRKTIRIINEKILEFKTGFAGKDMQDYVAMVVLWYATEREQGSAAVEKSDLESSLSRLEAAVDKALQG